MVESLKELNPICQKPRYKEVGNWMVRNLLRDGALPITWLLLHTDISANQVTTISLGVALLGSWLLALPAKGAFLAGTLLLQLWYLLDHVDGQIARYRKTACLSGRFFDFFTHHLIHGVLFFSLGFYLFTQSGRVSFLVWGFITSMSMMAFNLLSDVKHKTFVERLLSVEKVTVLEQSEGQAEKKTKSLGRSVFSFIHKSAEVHVLMNLLTIAALAEVCLMPHADLRRLLFVYYGLSVPLLATVGACYLILRRKIDEEFNAMFRVEERK